MKPIDRLTDDEFLELVQRSAALPDAPPDAMQAVIDLMPAARPNTLADLLASAGEVINAILSFDSWAAPAPAYGMRSAGKQSRHMLFNAEDRDVDLRIVRDADTFILTGQILGPDEGGTIVLLAESGQSDAAGSSESQLHGNGQVATLDALGEFRLTGLHAGNYQVVLRLGDTQLVLPPITVGEQPE